MKKAIVLFLTFSVFNFSFGQEIKNINSSTKSSTPKADKYFKQMWYKKAAEIYELELKKIDKTEVNENIRLLERAGDCYYFNTDMDNAYRHYNRLVSDYYSQITPEYIFRYAHTLEGKGSYKEAKVWMQDFSRKTKNKDGRSIEYSQDKETIEDVLNMEPQFVLHNMAINTKYSDFGPMYYNDKLVYSSAGKASYYHTRIYEWNKQPFLNMYVGKLNEKESDLMASENFSKTLNTRYHEATLAFSLDKKRVYFTRNNYNGNLKRDGNGTNHLKLYSADLKKNEKDTLLSWQNVKELPFNSNNYSVGHPSVSSDGKLLYFVSDMPGSLGATDIFVVDILKGEKGAQEKYSKPRNLGNTVNTAGREMFPFITDKTLYFSSDSHLGLGGLDVFESKIEKKNEGFYFQPPINLGKPLNSELDDFSFIIKEDTNTGFIASNRLKGKGDDDIYSFIRIKQLKKVLKGIPAKDLVLGTNCTQLVTGDISNTITGEKISNVTVTLYDVNGKKVETSLTNLNGKYTFKSVLKCNEKYKVQAFKQGYGDKNKDFLSESFNGETKVHLGLKTLHKLIVEDKGVLKVNLEIIYFNLDKSFIREDASIELNKIVALMQEYSNMVIRIESHTDSRNSDLYNLNLSDRRAKSTRKYILSQGIESTRIKSANGYGESILVNKCSNGVFCSEPMHQQNRRSEFIIIKM